MAKPVGPLAICMDVDYANMRVGLWCDKCLLPSAVDLPLTLMSEAGVMPAGVLTTCVEHDGIVEWKGWKEEIDGTHSLDGDQDGR